MAAVPGTSPQEAVSPAPAPASRSDAPASGGDVGIQCGQIWLDGKLVPQAQAQVSVLAHALHYGTSVFEGLRAYATPRGPAIFRLPEHTRRLFDSARIMRMPVPYSEQQLDAAIVETVRVNQWDSC
ncbi:MAG TPA: aminotransferase class IV, partial [Chloroflexota bacterium]|nr:aminotransferase class IV [Chloroflexota bacterium]